MLKLFRDYLWAFVNMHKADPDIEKAIDPVLFFIRVQQQIHLNLWSVDILSNYAERVSHAARYAGWLSFRVRKVIVHILK